MHMDRHFFSGDFSGKRFAFNGRFGSGINGSVQMRSRFLLGASRSKESSENRRRDSSLINAGAAAIAFTFLLLFLAGCSNKKAAEQSTPTSGSLAVYTSPAVLTGVQAGADQFNQLYQNANVNVYPLNSRAIIDSMINRRTDVGYFDRRISEAESLAVINSRKHLYSFLLGSTVATWIVNPQNRVNEIDSLQILEILTGKIKSWEEIGGKSQPINIYLPPLGDGAWAELEDFFGDALKQVDAHYWPNDSLIIERVSEDPAAIGFIGRQIFDSKVKKLRWVNPLLADAVNANIGTLQEGKYPFKIRLIYYTVADKTDLASGFLSFMASNIGQRLIADQGYLPEMVPARVVTLSSSEN